MSTVVAGLVLWAVAMVYAYFRPSLWLLDLIVVPLMWAFWIGGTALMAVGAVRVIGDRGRSPRVIAATAISALVVVLVSATVGIWWQVSPRGWFTTHRALYEQALDTDPGADYYGAYLPVHLRFLAAGGRMSGAPR